MVAPLPLFPRLRWVALVFLVVWVPSYAMVWGWRNFLQLCDVAVFLTVLGMWRGNALLLSSQTVGSLVINAFWGLDVLARLLTGAHFIGGTEYMWNAAEPLGVRLLSTFHLALPVVQIVCLRRTGYDRRGFRLEAALAGLILLVSWAMAQPGSNPNFTYVAPIFGTVGPPLVHLVLVYLTLLVVLVLPTHLALRRFIAPARA